MAIHPTLHPQTPSQGHLTPERVLAISAWTEQAAASLQNLSISEPAPGRDEDASESLQATPSRGPRGTSVALTIPLDDELHPADSPSAPRVKIVNGGAGESRRVLSSTYKRREPSRRDSLRRREALLKGKEGSRRRQRWENDRLLNNPWAQPPSASDWLIQPTYPRHENVPYYLAPLWDTHYAHKERGQSKRSRGDDKHQVPKELRLRLKHARAARGMLQDLEEDIRHFVQKWNEKQLMLQEQGLEDAPSSSEDSEDEIVFVGRNGQMHDCPERRRKLRQMREEMASRNEKDGEKMVLESLVDDRAAGFGRWLVHSIASYYGLYTWSVTRGNSRQAYVGFHPPAAGRKNEQISLPPASMASFKRATIKPGEPLPSPLWMQI
ncbi:hypothetical protein VTN00DRAFT_10377 [Thermoascus crustaceus]|uniref:uncharacterized protein n=1 Tax=Thermoascus crustaceus TaxID=5088 RepID=UPI003742D4FF